MPSRERADQIWKAMESPFASDLPRLVATIQDHIRLFLRCVSLVDLIPPDDPNDKPIQFLRGGILAIELCEYNAPRRDAMLQAIRQLRDLCERQKPLLERDALIKSGDAAIFMPEDTTFKRLRRKLANWLDVDTNYRPVNLVAWVRAVAESILKELIRDSNSTWRNFMGEKHYDELLVMNVDWALSLFEPRYGSLLLEGLAHWPQIARKVKRPLAQESTETSNP